MYHSEGYRAKGVGTFTRTALEGKWKTVCPRPLPLPSQLFSRSTLRVQRHVRAKGRKTKISVGGFCISFLWDVVFVYAYLVLLDFLLSSRLETHSFGEAVATDMGLKNLLPPFVSILSPLFSYIAPFVSLSSLDFTHARVVSKIFCDIVFIFILSRTYHRKMKMIDMRLYNNNYTFGYERFTWYGTV